MDEEVREAREIGDETTLAIQTVFREQLTAKDLEVQELRAALEASEKRLEAFYERDAL